MALPIDFTQRERTKFRDASGGPAVAVVNPDGTNVIGSGATVSLGLPLPAGSNFIGLATTVIGSAPTLYAVVNTAAAGQASVVLDAGTRYVGLASVNIGGTLPPLSAGANFIGLATSVIGSAPTLFAVVNTGAPGEASIALDPTPILNTTSKQAAWVSTATGSLLNVNLADRSGNAAVIDVSGRLLSSVSLNPSASFIGLATVVNANQPALVAGTAYVGLASVNIGGTLPALTAGAAYIGLASVNIGGTLPALAASSAFIGLISAASIQGKVQLVAGTAYAGLASVNIGPGTSYIGLASVNVGGSLPAGSNFIGLASVIANSGKVLNIAPIALAATNLSGATALVSSASKKWYVTSLVLSAASNVGMTFLNGATYIAGNASIRMQVAPQGGIAKDNNSLTPMLFALATQTNFLIATDTAAPVAGFATWYEE